MKRQAGREGQTGAGQKRVMKRKAGREGQTRAGQRRVMKRQAGRGRLGHVGIQTGEGFEERRPVDRTALVGLANRVSCGHGSQVSDIEHG